MAEPRVSIVMPVYERAHLVGRAVASVFAQRETDWELLIVDDGSRDRLAEALAPWTGDRRVRLMREPVNRGAPFCRNAGLAAARGEFVNFLDSDDELAPDKLERQLALFAADPALDVVVAGSVRRVAGEERAVQPIEPTSRRTRAREFVVKRIAWKMGAPLWRRRFLAGQAGFDESLGSGQDYEYYARAVLRDPAAAYLHAPLYLINDYDERLDPAKIRAAASSPARLADAMHSRRIVARHLAGATLAPGERLRLRLYLDLHLARSLRDARRVSREAYAAVLRRWLDGRGGGRGGG